MSDDIQVIECSNCGRLYEVAAGQVAAQCQCGQALGDSVLAASEGVETEPAASPSPGLLGRVGSNWRIFSIVILMVIGVGCLLAFLRSPDATLGDLKLRARGSLTAGSAAELEICLRILEDNSRSSEHLAAAGTLLQSPHKAFLINRLSQMAFRPELESRKLIVRTLGRMGDDRALPVLEKLFEDDDRSIVQLAAGAAARVDSADAESVLRKHFADPAWAREMLPAVAKAGNDTAARIVGSCLRRPQLRAAAIKEVGRSRMRRCVKNLIGLASDRSIPEPDRFRAMETLGTFKAKDVRRALADLVDDSTVGWKARQVLEEMGRL